MLELQETPYIIYNMKNGILSVQKRIFWVRSLFHLKRFKNL